MPTQQEKATLFVSLHGGPTPLLIPNPWDLGSAKVLVAMGFEALATTSGGFAATLGQVDGSVRRDEAVAHAAAIVAAADVPVSADFENCFAHEPAGVATTVELGIEAGLAGCSVEDWSGSDIYGIDHAAERVAAAAEAAHSGPVKLVLTGRAENHIHGRQDLADTITRLQHYQEAGADVLFAPGVIDADELRQLLREVDRPVNVVARPGCPPVAELAALGVRRVSVGACSPSPRWARSWRRLPNCATTGRSATWTGPASEPEAPFRPSATNQAPRTQPPRRRRGAPSTRR